ncbi:MAG: hypothetical protein QW084_00335 [Candidatus Hadarchaeales archaeon]
MMDTCPGIRKLVEPQIVLRTCPACGEEVEFFEYETETKCPKCGRKVHREASPSCVVWCKYADKCLEDLEKRKIITPARAEELRKLMKPRG